MAETILVIEDEPEFASLVELWISRAGYRAVLARTGPDGLRRFYEERPDLVILDVALPGFDGWQLISRLREFSRVPIIMVTARGSRRPCAVRRRPRRRNLAASDTASWSSMSTTTVHTFAERRCTSRRRSSDCSRI